MRFSLAVVICCLAAHASAQGPAPFMMLTHVGGEVLEGQPLTWTDDQMYLMGRDGRLYEFSPQAAQKSK
jgi:hypothetical protein